MKSPRNTRTVKEPSRVVVVGDTIISEQGLAAIIGRDPRYHVCGAAHTFEEANKLVRQHRPDVLLIEPFLENRDAIRWIKDLATERAAPRAGEPRQFHLLCALLALALARGGGTRVPP